MSSEARLEFRIRMTKPRKKALFVDEFTVGGKGKSIAGNKRQIFKDRTTHSGSAKWHEEFCSHELVTDQDGSNKKH